MMTKRKQTGFTLFEILGAIAILGLSLVALSEIDSGKSEQTKNENAAQFQAMVSAAASLYIRDNYAAVQAGATPTVPHKITLANLIPNYIPSTFSTAAKNAYGQSMCVLVLEPTANDLVGLLVTEGGEAIPTKHLTNVAHRSGPSGGYIDSTLPITAKGVNGGWSVPLSNYITDNCSGTAASAGHLASALFLDNKSQLQNFAYRRQVNGKPDANKFTTPLVFNTSITMIDGASCTTYGLGAIANNASGELMTCKGTPLTWEVNTGAGGGINQEDDPNGTWIAPVLDYVNLGTCNSSNIGQIKTYKNREYTPDGNFTPRICNGSSWELLLFNERGGYDRSNSPMAIEANLVKMGGSYSYDTASSTCSSLGFPKIDGIGNGAVFFSCKTDSSRSGGPFRMGPGMEGWQSFMPTKSDLDLITTDPTGTARVVVNTGQLFVRIGGTWVESNMDAFDFTNQTTSLSGRVKRAVTNSCNTASCNITATCTAPYTTVVDGECSGSAAGAGSIVSTTGWSCTNNGTSVQAIAYCQ